MISKQDFLKLFELSKTLKKRFIKIGKDSIIGTDELFTTVSIIYRNDNINIENNMYFDKNVIIALLKNDQIGYIDNKSIYDQIGYNVLWIGESLISSRLDRLENNIYKYITSPNIKIIYKIEDISELEQFINALSSKTSDGQEMININNNILTLYGGMYPINKNDTASLTLYDLGNNSILSEVNIIKNKPKVNIISYIRYRTL